MATCDNCIHYSLCDYNTNISGNGKVRLVYAEGAEKCSFFLNRADVAPTISKMEQVRIRTEVAKEFAEKVKPLFERIVELMFDGNEPTCQVENCHKPDSIGCGNRICIDENIAWWKEKVDNLAKEMTEGKNDE